MKEMFNWGEIVSVQSLLLQLFLCEKSARWALFFRHFDHYLSFRLFTQYKKHTFLTIFFHTGKTQSEGCV